MPHPEAALDLAEAIINEPWDVDDEARAVVDSETGWTRVTDAVIKLLGRLGRLHLLGEDATDRAWSLLAAATTPLAATGAADGLASGDYDAMTIALIRSWTIALNAALAVGSNRDGEPSVRLLALLDEILLLSGRDGLVARAALATQWPWLRARAPEWFAVNADRIFGDAATLEMYLECGAPDRALLIEQRDRIVTALQGDQHERAVHHLLHGLLWGLADYEPATIAAVLADAGKTGLGDAAHWMGTAFTGASEEIDVASIVDPWRAFLDLGLETPFYKDLGWMTVNERIADDNWLDLAVATVDAAKGDVAEPDQLAERATRVPSDPRAATIVAGLLAGNPDAWELQRIGAVGLTVLGSVSEPRAEELRERLLERGFYEARDV